MSDNHRTPYANDALTVENGTSPTEIRSFVDRRIKNPISVDGVTVWNFNNHEVNESALEQVTSDLYRDEYVIPFQASGVWGYMILLLPDRLRESEILGYNQSRGEYIPFPNYIRHAEKNDTYNFRLQMTAWMEESDI